MKKNFLVDSDEVLLDWITAFVEYAEVRLNKKLTYRPEFYDFDKFLNIPYNQAIELFYEFNYHSEKFETLKPMLYSKKYLPKIKDMGFEISVISAAGNHPNVYKRRKHNLITEFGDIFKDIICCDGDKESHLKLYEPSYWVEDKLSNAILGHKLNHKTFIIRHSYNVKFEPNHPELFWVDDWSDIYDFVCKENTITKL